MADTVIGASVEIDYKSIKDLKNALEGTEKQFKEMVDTFGEGSEQAQQAQKKLLALQDGINKKTEEYNDKVDAAAGTVSALNATVGGLQGALELTGMASEDTEKALAKLTAALSVGDAIQNLAEFGPMIKTTFKTIKDSGVAAFKALRVAIGSTGIGLLVIALGAIVAYWDDIKAAVTGVTGEMKKLNVEAQKNADAAQQSYDEISRTEETLKRNGKTERQILLMKIKQAEQVTKYRIEQAKASQEQLKAQMGAADRNQKILAGILKWINAPLVLIAKQVDAMLKLVGLSKYAQLEASIDKASTWAASFVFDPKDFEQQNAELQKQAQEAENTLNGHKNQLQAMDDAAAKERAAKAKAAADKARAEREKQQAEEEKLREAALAAETKAVEDLAKSKMTARQVELYELHKAYLEQKKTIEAGGKSTTALTELYNKQKAEIEQKYRQEQLQKEKDYRDALQAIMAETEGNAGKTEAEIARQAVIEKYKKRREEEEKQNRLTFTMRLALQNAEEAELAKIDEDERQKQLKKQEAKFQKDAANADLSFKDRIAALQGQLSLANELEFESEDERKDYIEKTEKDITALRKAEQEKQIADFQEYASATIGVISTLKQANDTDLNIKKEQYNQDLANLQQMLDNKQISQEQFDAKRKELDAQQNEELKKSFKRNQVFSIAEALINTATAVTNALKLPFPLNFIQAAAVGLLGGLQVKMISKQKPEQVSTPSPIISTAGGGGGAAPIEAGMSAALQGQALNAEAINALGNNAMRAYVLNSDIQNNSQRNAYLQRNARIG